MRRLLYVVGVLDVTWVLISLGGIITDPDSLSFWSQNLLASLLLAVFVAPALVFWRSDASTAPASRPEKVRQPRSPARIATYALSGLLVLWLFVSLFGLFLQSDQVAFWGQSLMWSLIATVLIAPLLVFFVNPLQDPILVDEERISDASAEPFISEDAYAPSFLNASAGTDAPESPTASETETPAPAPASEIDADARQGWPWNVEDETEDASGTSELETVEEMEAVEDVETVQAAGESGGAPLRATASAATNAPSAPKPSTPKKKTQSAPKQPRRTSDADGSTGSSGDFRIHPPAADADESWPAWPDDESSSS